MQKLFASIFIQIINHHSLLFLMSWIKRIKTNDRLNKLNFILLHAVLFWIWMQANNQPQLPQYLHKEHNLTLGSKIAVLLLTDNF